LKGNYAHLNVIFVFRPLTIIKEHIKRQNKAIRRVLETEKPIVLRGDEIQKRKVNLG